MEVKVPPPPPPPPPRPSADIASPSDATGQGAAAPPVKASPAEIEKAETEFTAQVDALHGTLLNLNLPMDKVGADLEQVMMARRSLLGMYGIKVQGETSDPSPTAKGGGKGAVLANMTAAFMQMMGGEWNATGGTTTPQDSNYKSLLNTAVSKRAGRSLTKNDVIYTVKDAEGVGGYICCVSAPGLLAQDYWSAAPSSNKKWAEQSAAQVAYEAEFPEDGWESNWWDSGPGKKKRKLDQALYGDDSLKDPKSQLIHAAQLLLGRSVSKADIVYDVQQVAEVGPGKYQATVSLPTYDPAEMYTGEAASDQKGAQMNAAEAAMATLADKVEPLKEEKRQKRIRESQEKMAKFKARRSGYTNGYGYSA